MNPFAHWILEEALPESLVGAVGDDVPPAEWPHWVRYDNPQERKRTSREIHRFSGETCRLFHFLNSAEWIEQLEATTGITGLVPDVTYHGGGMHCCDPGGHLDVHIDYALHPILKLERRLNLVLFLNRDWDNAWGGALELWNDTATACVKAIFPRFNRVVLWEPSDIAYHGHPRPLLCPPNQCRQTAAVYYLAPPRGAHVLRQRALFVPRRETNP